MSVRREDFEVGDRPQLDLDVKSGNVTVRAGSAGTATVTVDGSDVDDWNINQMGATITVQSPRGRIWGGRSARVHVEVPAGADASIKTASADVSITGTLGSTRVRTASGDVHVDDVDRLDTNSASGDVRAASVAGDASCTTASGDVDLSSVHGRLTVSTASGDVRVARASDDLQIGSASGDVRIDRYDGASIVVKSMSGDVTVGLPSGIRVEPDLSTLSGRTTLPAPSTKRADGDRRMVRVRIETVSGNIGITRA